MEDVLQNLTVKIGFDTLQINQMSHCSEKRQKKKWKPRDPGFPVREKEN